MNCFMGGSHVRRYPDDRAGLPPPGADGEAAGRFDLAFVDFDLDDDMMSYDSRFLCVNVVNFYQFYLSPIILVYFLGNDEMGLNRSLQ